MAIYLDDNRANLAFRRAVTPESLRPFILTEKGNPRSEWRYSLKTTDRRKALELCHLWAVKTDRELREAEAKRDAWLIASALSPEEKDRERRRWEAEREADDLRSQDDMRQESLCLAATLFTSGGFGCPLECTHRRWWGPPARANVRVGVIPGG